jgi:hypothetical protein
MSKRPGDPGYAAGWCVHYRSDPRVRSEDATCEAGVRYVDFNDGKTAGMYLALPCFRDKKTGEQKHPNARPCAKVRVPTTEDVTAHEAWLYSRMTIFSTVMKGIQPWRAKYKGKSAQEVVECPACKGRLHLSIAACNGHVHGQCETTYCVSWME